MKPFIRLILVAACVALVSCGGASLTVAPKPVASHQASYSGNEQNSGMVKQPDVGEQGFAVNQDWVDGYDSLLSKFGQTLNPPRKAGDRDGITPEAGHYRITDQVLMRHDVMNAARRASLKPPSP